MTHRTRQVFGDERGAMLAHVAAAIVVMVAFTTFVADYGVLWTSRRQAQNAADAGAIAGAIALAYDDPNDFTNTGPAKQSAWAATQRHFVWDQVPSVLIASDITFPVCPDGTNTCIRVDVYRNTARGNALPMFFGNLVGLTSQGIQATATAQVKIGNASNCLKPWAVPDKWIEIQTPVYDPTDTFDKYETGGPWRPPLLPNPDIYTAPTTTNPGTGFTVALDLGTQLVIKPGNPNQSTKPGWFYPIQLDPTCIGATGGSCYEENIANCVNVTWGVGDYLPAKTGNMVGPTGQGTDELIALDPYATWDPNGGANGTGAVVNSCVNNGTCPQYTQSPRIADLPIIDLNEYEDNIHNGTNMTLKIVNILGFFIENRTGNDITGRLVTKSAQWSATKGGLGGASGFTKVIVLIR